MTKISKRIIDKLFSAHYLRGWKSNSGAACFRLYNSNGDPVSTVRAKTVKSIDKYIDPKINIWKKDKTGKITLNLKSIRQLHGKTYLKQQYKKSKQVA